MKHSTRSDPPPQRVRRRALLGAVCAVALLPKLAPAADAKAADAEAFIRDIGDKVMTILTDDSKSDAEKLVELKKILDNNTDLDLVARLVLGRYWRTASDEERKEYVELFHELLMKTLASRLGDYNGQTFEVTGSQQVSDSDSVVTTKIIRVGDGPPLKVDWRVRDEGGKFALIDVVAEGVSLVVSQRNEVGSIVERQGMEGLLETMRKRRDALI